MIAVRGAKSPQRPAGDVILPLMAHKWEALAVVHHLQVRRRVRYERRKLSLDLVGHHYNLILHVAVRKKLGDLVLGVYKRGIKVQPLLQEWPVRRRSNQCGIKFQRSLAPLYGRGELGRPTDHLLVYRKVVRILRVAVVYAPLHVFL